MPRQNFDGANRDSDMIRQDFAKPLVRPSPLGVRGHGDTQVIPGHPEHSIPGGSGNDLDEDFDAPPDGSKGRCRGPHFAGFPLRARSASERRCLNPHRPS